MTIIEEARRLQDVAHEVYRDTIDNYDRADNYATAAAHATYEAAAVALDTAVATAAAAAAAYDELIRRVRAEHDRLAEPREWPGATP